MKIVSSFIIFGAIALAQNTAAFAGFPTQVCEFETTWGFQEAKLAETIETTSTGPLVMRFMEVNESDREITLRDSDGNPVPGTIETYNMRSEERYGVPDGYEVFREVLVAWTPDARLAETTYSLDTGQRHFDYSPNLPSEIVVQVVDTPVPPATTEPVAWEIGRLAVPRISCDPLRRCKYNCTEQADRVLQTMNASFEVTGSRSIVRRLLRVTPNGEKVLSGDWISDKDENWISDRPLPKHVAHVIYGSAPACFRSEVLNLADEASVLGEIHCFDEGGEVIDLASLLEVDPPDIKVVPDPDATPDSPASEQNPDSGGCSTTEADSPFFLIFLGIFVVRRRK